MDVDEICSAYSVPAYGICITNSPRSYSKDLYIEQVFSNALAEENILSRSIDFYSSLIDSGHFLFALKGESIVGHIGLELLSTTTAEMVCGWVRKDYRGCGIYTQLKKSILSLAEKKCYRVIGTNKLKNRSSVGALASSMSQGLYPVSFNFLRKIDPLAFRATCSCDDNHNWTNCPLRDLDCILSINMKTESDVAESNKFLSTKEWCGMEIIQRIKVIDE